MKKLIIVLLITLFFVCAKKTGFSKPYFAKQNSKGVLLNGRSEFYNSFQNIFYEQFENLKIRTSQNAIFLHELINFYSADSNITIYSCIDKNRNKILDSGEKYLSGIKYEILNESGSIVAEIYSNSDGKAELNRAVLDYESSNLYLRVLKNQPFLLNRRLIETYEMLIPGLELGTYFIFQENSESYLVPFTKEDLSIKNTFVLTLEDEIRQVTVPFVTTKEKK